MDQKKKTTFKYSTLRIGGTNAKFTIVAGTHNFPKQNNNNMEEKMKKNYVSIPSLKKLYSSVEKQKCLVAYNLPTWYLCSLHLIVFE